MNECFIKWMKTHRRRVRVEADDPLDSVDLVLHQRDLGGGRIREGADTLHHAQHGWHRDAGRRHIGEK